MNSFFVDGQERWSAEHPPVMMALDGTHRLLECTGTRFMIRYLNSLDARYPYVDNAKPFSRFIRIFGASALVLGWGPLDAVIAVTKMLAYVSKTAVIQPTDLLGVAEDLPHALVSWIEQASDEERGRLSASLRNQGFPLSVPLDMLLGRPDDLVQLFEFLATRPDLVAGLGEKDPALLGGSPGTLTLTRGFNANETCQC